MRRNITFLWLNFLIFHLSNLPSLFYLWFFLIFIIRIVIPCFFQLLFGLGVTIQLGLSNNITRLIFDRNLEIGFWNMIFFGLLLPFLSRGRQSDVLIRVLEQSLDEDGVFFLDTFIDTWLIFLGHTRNYILDCASVFFHLLVVTSALTGISGDDHVRHHFVYPSVFLELRVF